MYKVHFTAVAILCALASSQSARAQACAGNTGVMGGAYVFASISTGNGPGTAVSSSNTEIGHLIAGIASGTPFSVTGAFSFDTLGQVFASPSVQSGASTYVGTYAVNSDCTISLTLIDSFSSAAPTAKLSGIILGGGSEVDLFMTSTAGAQTAGIQSQSGLLIRLIRPFFGNFGCTAGNLSGSYALVLSGANSATSTLASQPLTLVTRVNFDGTSSIMPDLNASASPLASVQSIGTYVVNSDCSGTMVLKASSAATSPATTVNFALTAPTIVLSLGATNLSRYSTRPSLVLSLSSATQTAIGVGTAQ